MTLLRTLQTALFLALVVFALSSLVLFRVTAQGLQADAADGGNDGFLPPRRHQRMMVRTYYILLVRLPRALHALANAEAVGRELLLLAERDAACLCTWLTTHPNPPQRTHHIVITSHRGAAWWT